MKLDDLFNMSGSIEDISTEPVKKPTDENLYSINLNDAIDGVYKAKIRFLPNYRNVKKSILTKYTYWLTEANGENGIFVDDPSTIGEKSPIGDLYWKLKKSSNPLESTLAEQLKRGRKYYSLVQIIEDTQHPELENKIMVFGYGIKIKEKIDSEFNDADEGANPFDVFNGRVFRLEVKKVGGFQNYDACKFIGGAGASPIVINGKKMTNNDKEKIYEYLKNSPELENYDFKPWTAEFTEMVNERLNTYRSNNNKKPIVEAAITQETEDESRYETHDKTVDDDDDFLKGINL